ncbi:putative phage tail minor protein [Yoonia vestfoldensis SKA53]|jgi:phage-related minor tail protein|uniref:Putative phage tail minor protein n=2 Tax=Yoonia vestfoldensis TaxID=245188 RepID=A3V969_9RHOB|nr:putative phage tail minor protein [Yoonia vestfoldensis SKA53]
MKMNDLDRLDAFDSDISALERSLGDVSAVTAAFEAQLRGTQTALSDTTRDLGNLERGFSNGLRRALDGLVLDGKTLSDVFAGLGRSMSGTVYNAALKPVTDHFGGMLAGGLNSLVSGLMPFADGAPFSQGRVMPFAKGGIVSSPTTFPMRGGTGLMGEAGPEAIMPLARGPDGRLGVRGGGGGGVHVTMQITTPDVQGFQRSQSQIAQQMARAMQRSQRNS